MSDLIERLQKLSVCVYLAAEESVADDIADGLKQAAARIKELEAAQIESANFNEAARLHVAACSAKIEELESSLAAAVAGNEVTAAAKGE